MYEQLIEDQPKERMDRTLSDFTGTVTSVISCDNETNSDTDHCANNITYNNNNNNNNDDVESLTASLLRTGKITTVSDLLRAIKAQNQHLDDHLRHIKYQIDQPGQAADHKGLAHDTTPYKHI